MRKEQEIQKIVGGIQNGTTTFANFTKMGLTLDDVKKIAEALKTNITVTFLGLAENNIDDEGAKIIAEIFKTNSTLTKLNLSHNNIGNPGAIDLASALTHKNCKVTLLNLAQNCIYDAGIRALKLAGWDYKTGCVTIQEKPQPKLSTNLLASCTKFVKAHKTQLVLGTVAACAILATCYKKPEMLTSLKNMFFGMFERASSFVMGK